MAALTRANVKYYDDNTSHPQVLVSFYVNLITVLTYTTWGQFINVQLIIQKPHDRISLNFMLVYKSDVFPVSMIPRLRF